MSAITLDLPDDLVEQLRSLAESLPRVLALGIHELDASPSQFAGMVDGLQTNKYNVVGASDFVSTCKNSDLILSVFGAGAPGNGWCEYAGNVRQRDLLLADPLEAGRGRPPHDPALGLARGMVADQPPGLTAGRPS